MGIGLQGHTTVTVEVFSLETFRLLYDILKPLAGGGGGRGLIDMYLVVPTDNL